MEKGEASTQFFKTYASLSKPVVHEMRLWDGTNLTTLEAIHSGAVDFFSSFLRARPHRDLPDLSVYVQNTILEEENDCLLQLPSIQEVKDAMFSIPINSSPTLTGLALDFIERDGILLKLMWWQQFRCQDSTRLLILFSYRKCSNLQVLINFGL